MVELERDRSPRAPSPADDAGPGGTRRARPAVGPVWWLDAGAAGQSPARAAVGGDGRGRAADARLAVTIGVEDPAERRRRWCIEQYFAELGERFEGGFDPPIAIAAPISELEAASGLMLVATAARAAGWLRGARHHARAARSSMKRMWVSPEVRGSASAEEAAAGARSGTRRGRRGHCPAGDEPVADGGDRHVPQVGVPRRWRRSTRSRTPSLVRKASGLLAAAGLGKPPARSNERPGLSDVPLAEWRERR